MLGARGTKKLHRLYLSHPAIVDMSDTMLCTLSKHLEAICSSPVQAGGPT